MHEKGGSAFLMQKILMKMKTNLTFACIVTALVVGVVACKKDEAPQTHPDKHKIAESITAEDIHVTLWADEPTLTVAYTPLYITLENGSGKVTNKLVRIHPEMDMHTMSHSSPVEQPVFDATTGLYAGAVVFTMPSGDMGSWKLTVEVGDHAVDLAVTVHPASNNTRLVGSFVGTDNERYTIALVQPTAPKTGVNDLELLISRRENMHDFPPVDGLEVIFEPEMPSMGHGSPNNVDPVGVGNGRYRGKANFTMTGDWRLHFTLKRDGETVVEDAYLDILF